MWIKNDFFKYLTGIVLVLLTIFMVGKVSFFIEPFFRLIAILFFPLLISGLVYYLMRPILRLASRTKLPTPLIIIAIFMIFIIVFGFLGSYSGALIAKQFQQFAADLPKLIETIRDKADELLKNNTIGSPLYTKFEREITTYLEQIIPILSSGLWGGLSAVTNAITTLVVVPFIVFYFLRDDRKFLEKILKRFPLKYKDELIGVLKDTDKALSTYIIGQAMIALILGILMYIGYVIIGLKYSFLLALLVVITSFIPLLGTLIGVIPAFFVGLADNPWMAFNVLVVMIIVQQLEGNLISPFLIGKRMDIHPLTIIIIFLVAGSLYGFIGVLIVVPTYAVLKVIVRGAIKIYRIWKTTPRIAS